MTIAAANAKMIAFWQRVGTRFMPLDRKSVV